MASKLNVDKIARGSGTPEFTWPTADGTAGQAMVTNASGVLSFADAGPSLTGSTNTWIPTITGANALTGTANFTYDGNTLDVKNSGTASSINLYCETGNAHYIKLKSGPHASATSYTLTLPNAPPSVSGQALTATTGGVASWAAAGETNTPNFRAATVADVAWSSTYTTIIYSNVTGTNLWNNGGGWDTTNYRFVCPAGQGGKYLFGAAIGIGSSATWWVKVRRNGSEYVHFQSSGGYGGNVVITGETTMALDATDWMDFQTYSSSNWTNFGSQCWGLRIGD